MTTKTKYAKDAIAQKDSIGTVICPPVRTETDLAYPVITHTHYM